MTFSRVSTIALLAAAALQGVAAVAVTLPAPNAPRSICKYSCYDSDRDGNNLAYAQPANDGRFMCTYGYGGLGSTPGDCFYVQQSGQLVEDKDDGACPTSGMPSDGCPHYAPHDPTPNPDTQSKKHVQKQGAINLKRKTANEFSFEQEWAYKRAEAPTPTADGPPTSTTDPAPPTTTGDGGKQGIRPPDTR